MAVKTIRFRNNTSPTIADGANGMLLASTVSTGVYPQTVNGITAGWSPDNPALLPDGVGITGDAKFGEGLATLASGAADRRIRIDRAAGTFVVRLQAGLTQGGSAYATPRLRIIDADGTTVLFAQSGGSVNADGDAQPMQINTNGSKQVVGAADAGQSITTTGAFFFVELTGAGAFQDRLSYIEWDDGVSGTTTQLGLRITAGGTTVDLAPLPLRVGGGGGGSLLARMTWPVLGNESAQLRDSTNATPFNSFIDCSTPASLVMNVVTAASASLPSWPTTNALRLTARGQTNCGNVQWNPGSPLGLSQSHYGRLWFNVQTGFRDNHGIAYNCCTGFGGPIQFVPLSIDPAAGGPTPSIKPSRNGAGTGLGYPFNIWVPGTPGSGANSFACTSGATYRYEWRIEYLNTLAFRMYPRLYNAAGTLLFDVNSYYMVDQTPGVGANGVTLAAWYAAGNSFGMSSADLGSRFSIGHEGPFGSADTGAHWFIGDVAFDDADWIGTA
jgi:hypothetical protein